MCLAHMTDMYICLGFGRPPDKITNQSIQDALNITSLNIEGIKGNSAYLNHLLAKENIVCLQEHWLWEFESNILEQFSDEYDFFVRCADTFEEGFSDQFVPRGRGGVCILWHKSMSKTY